MQARRRFPLRRFVLALCCALFVVLSAIGTQAQAPTNGNLVRFGYYFVNERDGDDTATVWPYTNLYVAIPNGYDSDVADWQTPFAASLDKATVNHKAIYLIMSDLTQGQQVITWDDILDVATGYWGQIAYIDIAQEQSLSSTALNSLISSLNTNLDNRSLSHRPVGATFTRYTLNNTTGISASGLAFANIEAYLDAPGSGNAGTDASALDSYLAADKLVAHNAGKQIFLTMQAFDRNGVWTNMTTLAAIQPPVWTAAYADTDVIGILAFSYNRTGGTKAHSQLEPAHRQIGALMGISPAMFIDTPANNTSQTQPFTIAGWAIDLAATSSTGVDTVHVWAYPSVGSPVMVGALTVANSGYGGYRSDVGTAFGSTQWDNSGYGVSVTGLATGTYTFVVYSHSAVSNTFNIAKSVVVTVY